MNRFKKVIISILIALSLTIVTPELVPNQIYEPSITHIQAKTKYVYITRTGSKYHTHKCGNGTYYRATLKKAKSLGLKPCKKCFR